MTMKHKIYCFLDLGRNERSWVVSLRFPDPSGRYVALISDEFFTNSSRAFNYFFKRTKAMQG